MSQRTLREPDTFASEAPKSSRPRTHARSRNAPPPTQELREVAPRPSDRVDTTMVAADYVKTAVVLLAYIVVVLCVASAASSRWVATSSVSRSGGTQQQQRLAPWNYASDYWFETGAWKSCNCTGALDGPVCSRRSQLMQTLQALCVLTVLLESAALVLFVFGTFVLFSNDTVEWGSVACCGCACVIALCSWILCIVLFVDTSCGQQSFRAAGFGLHWGFAMRLIESLFLAFTVGAGVVRRWRTVGSWALTYLLLIVLAVSSVSSSSSNQWMQIAAGYDANDLGATVQVGPWATCSCRTASHRCGGMASKLQALEAFDILEVIAAVVQASVLGFVPEVFSRVPSWAVCVTVGLAWLLQLCTWSLAIGTFSDCSCAVVESAHFDWPLAIALLSFVAQSALCVLVILRVARQYVLEWAATAAFRSPTALLAPQPFTSAAPETSEPLSDMFGKRAAAVP